MKLLLSTLFVMIFMITLVSAVPPFVDSGSFTEGYQLEYPIIDNIEASKHFDFHFHVFNISNGMPISSGINCSIHLYNASGNHIYEAWDGIASHNFDYAWDIPGSYFTKPGDYTYIAQCNDSDLGGFISAEFTVRSSKMGIDNQSFIGFFFIFALALLVFGMLIKNQYIGFISALLFIVGGVYMIIYGYGPLSDLYTRAVGFSAIGIGSLVALSAAYKTYQGVENEF